MGIPVESGTSHRRGHRCPRVPAYRPGRAWVFRSRPGSQDQGCRTLRVAVWCWLLLVDPRVFRAPGPAVVPPAPSIPVVVGVLHYTKPSGGVSPACRSLMLCNSPRLVALRPWCWLVWRPQCRPPWQTPVNTGCCRRGGPRCGHNSACRGVLLAREPLNMRVNPLIRTSTPQHAPGRGRPRTSHRANVRDVRPACRSSGPRAGCQAHVQVIRPACRSSGPRAPSRTRVRMGRPMRGHVDPSADSDTAGRELRNSGRWS